MAAKLALAGGLVVLFAGTVLILSKVMPGSHRPSDFLVMGAVGTFVCLIGLLLFHVSVSARTQKSLPRRRK